MIGSSTLQPSKMLIAVCRSSLLSELSTSFKCIPGDRRCLFRSVVHGACLRAGKPSQTENRERELADELRATVADEFIKRRADSEWFVEGDFDIYVAQMRQPHVWGGEPELLMSSHVFGSCLHLYSSVHAEYGQDMERRSQSTYFIMVMGTMTR